MKYHPVCISKEQECRLREGCAGTDIELVVFLALTCGMRRREIVDFRKSDFNMTTGTLCIPYRENGCSLLCREIRLTHDESSYLGRIASASVFQGSEGSARYLTDKVRRVCRLYCGTNVGLRELRHTAIIRQIARNRELGKNKGSVFEWAGYNDYSTFCNIYGAF